MNDQPTTNAAAPSTSEPDQGAAPGEANDLLAALRDDKFLAASLDERDVSIVYIDRRNQRFQMAAPAGGERATSRVADRGARSARRIGNVVVSALGASEAAAVQATFTPPASFAAAQRILVDHGLLILHGEAGSGKRSAAIHLLAGLHAAGSDRPVLYELNPDLRLANLDPDAMPARTALLLESATGAALEGMSSFHWNALLDVIGPQKLDSGLVITVARPPEMLLRERRQVLCHWQAEWPGDRTAVQWNILARHVEHLLRLEGLDTALASDALAAWQAHTQLAGLLSQRLLPYQIAELAAILLPVLTGDATIDAALARHDLHVEAAVQRWFADSGHSLESKTLLIAAAVFNGALADEVDLAAADLLAQIAPPAKATADAPPVDPFAGGVTRSARYKQIGASLVSTPIQGLHYGATTGLALQLDNRAWQKAVLDHLWSEYSALRDPLLAWLERYALEGSQRQRVRAAAAIGALAQLNFALIEARVLRQWASSRDASARRAAAQVLGITIWDEQHGEASIGLLRHWAALDNWRFRWSAAAACGGLAGLRYFGETLTLLEKIAAVCVAQPQLLPPLSEALVKLYLAGRDDPDRRAAIVHALRTWAEPPAPNTSDRARAFALRRTAVLCWWGLLWPAPTDPVWRQVVDDMAVPGTAVQADGVALLRASLNFRQPEGSVHDTLHPRTLARQGLRALVEAIGRSGDDELLAHGAGMLQALVQACHCADEADGSDEAERLRYYAEEWEKLPDRAQELRGLFLG